MSNESTQVNKESKDITEKFTVQLTNAMSYDRLHTLAAEYSMSVDTLINLAVKRLISDIDFVRNLRTGKVELK